MGVVFTDFFLHSGTHFYSVRSSFYQVFYISTAAWMERYIKI